MKAGRCRQHPDRDIVTKCGWCEKEICQECIDQAKGKKFCADCANRFRMTK
ncbi:MAG: hypothetical protein V1645_01845 [archaeon]